VEEAAAGAAEIASAAQASGNATSLALAELLRGRIAAARSDWPAARRHLDEAARLASDSGNLDIAAEARLVRAGAERSAGDLGAARRVAEATVEPFAAAREHRLWFEGEALLAWLDAREGHPAAARRRLALLDAAAGGDGARAPSLPLRLAYLRARAELARAEGRGEQAARDLETAVAAAVAGTRGATATALRGELEALAAPHARLNPAR
jgi:hypothetical protein